MSTKITRQLELLADNTLKKYGGNPDAALSKFVIDLFSNPLLARALALRYLQERAGQSVSGTRRSTARSSSEAGHQSSRDSQRQDVRSLRGPSAAQRAATTRIKLEMAKTVLDSFKVSDGRSIGDVRFFELPILRRKSQREAYVLDQLSRHVANAPATAYVRDIIKATELEVILRNSESHISNVA